MTCTFHSSCYLSATGCKKALHKEEVPGSPRRRLTPMEGDDLNKRHESCSSRSRWKQHFRACQRVYTRGVLTGIPPECCSSSVLGKMRWPFGLSGAAASLTMQEVSIISSYTHDLNVVGSHSHTHVVTDRDIDRPSQGKTQWSKNGCKKRTQEWLS